MDVFETIRGRRSIRKYKDEPVEQEKLGAVLEACRWSPSAGNRQPWEIIIVDDPEIKEKIAEAALEQMWMKTAPFVLVVCINENKARGTYGERGDMYDLETIGMALENMMLTAHSLGLGTCCVGAFEDKRVKDLLECLEFVRPVALLTLGYPAEERPVTPRDEVSEFTFYNSYRNQYEPYILGIRKAGRKARKRLYQSLKNC